MGKTKSNEVESLLQNQAFTTFVLEKCPSAIYLINRDTSFHYVNQAAVKSTGYTREELLQIGVTELDPWYNAAEWPHHFQEVKESGMQKIETRHRRKDGKLIAVEVYTHYIEMNGEEFLCAFAKDITGVVDNSEKLSEMASRYEYLFDNFPSPVLVINADGILIGINPEASGILGYQITEMAGKPISEFMCDESRSQFRSMFDSVLKEDNVSCTINFCKPDGSEFRSNCRPVVVVDENEEIKSVLVFLTPSK